MSRTLSLRALFWCCVSLSLTAFLALAQTAPAPATGPASAPASPRVAVVSLEQIYERLDEKLYADHDLDNARADYTRQVETKRKELEALNTEVATPTMFKAGSSEHLKMQDELLQKTIDLQGFTQLCQQKLFIQLRTRFLDIHHHMDEAIAAYAKANNIVLVLGSDEVNFAAARSPQELEEFPKMLKLAYFQPNYDITRPIVEKMNLDYNLRLPPVRK